MPDGSVALPDRPPFTLRSRVLTPLGEGGVRHELDALVSVDQHGRLGPVRLSSSAAPADLDAAVDLRGWVVLPGLVDLHAHLPQVPNAGLGYALPLLTWLDRLTFPTERSWSDPLVAESLRYSRLRPVFVCVNCLSPRVGLFP